MKKIVIDLDETICEGGYLEALNHFLHTDYTYDDIADYYVEGILPKDQLDPYLDYFYEKINVYQYMKEIPDAIATIEKLAQKYDVYICSAYVDSRRPYNSAIMATYKHRWILDHLPFIEPKHVILTGAKEMIDCDIRIDDKFSNLKGKGEIKLLLDSYHNQQYTEEQLIERGVTRVEHWKEIADILL